MNQFRILGLLFLSLVVACQPIKENGPENANLEAQNPSKLEIRFDKNLETLALIYNLSEAGTGQFERNPAPRAMLARTLTKRFEQFKAHAAVKKVDSLINNDFVDSYDICLALYSTALPAFEQYADYPPIYYENDVLNVGQVKAVFDNFNAAVRQFYKDAKLDAFFEVEGAELYLKLMQEVKEVAPEPDYITKMEAYYGLERHSYTIVVSAFAFNGIGRSATIRTDSGIDIYQLVTSNPENESFQIDLADLESFTIGYTDKNYFREIATHELGHSFFHEALRENKSNIAQLDALSYLFTDSLRVDMQRQGYADWRMCFEEHLVRLGEIQVAKMLGDEAFVAAYTKECMEKRGFKYFSDLQEIFLEYEGHRNIYPEIGDFIPVLLERLKQIFPVGGK